MTEVENSSVVATFSANKSPRRFEVRSPRDRVPHKPVDTLQIRLLGFAAQLTECNALIESLRAEVVTLRQLPAASEDAAQPIGDARKKFGRGLEFYVYQLSDEAQARDVAIEAQLKDLYTRRGFLIGAVVKIHEQRHQASAVPRVSAPK